MGALAIPRIGALMFVDPAQKFQFGSDRELIAEHGALWIMDGVHDKLSGMLASHSLATGQFHVWYTHEVKATSYHG